jgi:hypothetical protein
MQSSYLERLPIETLKTILFDLNVEDVIYYCETHVQQNNLCQSNKFWEEYIFYNHDLKRLYKEIDLQLMASRVVAPKDWLTQKLKKLIVVIEIVEY